MTDLSTLEFDLKGLSRWLGLHVRDFVGPLRAEKFAGGQSNPTYKLLNPPPPM